MTKKSIARIVKGLTMISLLAILSVFSACSGLVSDNPVAQYLNEESSAESPEASSQNKGNTTQNKFGGLPATQLQKEFFDDYLMQIAQAQTIYYERLLTQAPSSDYLFADTSEKVIAQAQTDADSKIGARIDELTSLEIFSEKALIVIEQNDLYLVDSPNLKLRSLQNDDGVFLINYGVKGYSEVPFSILPIFSSMKSLANDLNVSVLNVKSENHADTQYTVFEVLENGIPVSWYFKEGRLYLRGFEHDGKFLSIKYLNLDLKANLDDEVNLLSAMEKENFNIEFVEIIETSGSSESDLQEGVEISQGDGSKSEQSKSESSFTSSSRPTGSTPGASSSSMAEPSKPPTSKSSSSKSPTSSAASRPISSQPSTIAPQPPPPTTSTNPPSSSKPPTPTPPPASPSSAPRPIVVEEDKGVALPNDYPRDALPILNGIKITEFNDNPGIDSRTIRMTGVFSFPASIVADYYDAYLNRSDSFSYVQNYNESTGLIVHVLKGRSFGWNVRIEATENYNGKDQIVHFYLDRHPS